MENGMNIEVRRLAPGLIDDYINFFENDAFSDGSDFAGCYCVWYHWTEEMQAERSKCPEDGKKCFKRNMAINYIKEHKLNGFLAYSDGRVVGWCNADLKQKYVRLSPENSRDIWAESDVNDKVMSIVCYLVSPDMRRKGIATELLKAVCKYAEENGYNCIEAYPGTNDDGTPHYHGTHSMYRKQGFMLTKDSSSGTIVRKYF
jgi:GNAT superfamily N-acetyltransferase